MIELVDIEQSTSLDGLIPRHGRDGRPKIFPESEYGKATPKGEFYTRTTTFIDALDDKSNLADWKLRLLLEGVTRNPDLLTEYRDLLDPSGSEKRLVNRIAERAIDLADGGLKADQGTAYHAVTEAIDRGEDPFVPFDIEGDIEAYRQATRDLDMLSIEEFCVEDTLKFAGTFDRAVRVNDELAEQISEALGFEGALDSRVGIADVKTGRRDFSRGKFGMQFAGYSRMKRYDPVTYARSPLVFDNEPVSQTWGLMIHLPVGGKTCSLIPIDLSIGWSNLLLAAEVREYRKFWNRKASEFKVIRSVEL